MLRSISQIKRLSTPLPDDDSIVLHDTVRVARVKSVDEKSKRVLFKTERRTVDRSEEMKPYRVSDFCLDNMIALGVKMTPSVMAASPHKSITDMASVLDSVPIPESNDSY